MTKQFDFEKAIDTQIKIVALMQDNLERSLLNTKGASMNQEVLKSMTSTIANATQAWETLIRIQRETSPTVRRLFNSPSPTFGEEE